MFRNILFNFFLLAPPANWEMTSVTISTGVLMLVFAVLDPKRWFTVTASVELNHRKDSRGKGTFIWAKDETKTMKISVTKLTRNKEININELKGLNSCNNQKRTGVVLASKERKDRHLALYHHLRLMLALKQDLKNIFTIKNSFCSTCEGNWSVFGLIGWSVNAP